MRNDLVVISRADTGLPRDRFRIGLCSVIDDQETGGWYLVELSAVTRGGGRASLERLCALADRHDAILECEAVPLPASAGLEMTEKRLIRWYKRFGFKHLGGETMRRTPGC